ncbi:MAG TPA: hypothetical protein VIK15_04270 [Candidatus Anoxymicrobiaceae bacterium]|jgi:hypothetical protein
MKRRKMTRLAVLAALGYAAALSRLKPKPADLVDLEWQSEAPLRLTMLGLTRLMPWLYRTRGEVGVKALQYVFYQVGVDRAQLLKQALDIDPNDARSLGRVLDYEDGLVGVRGIWTEEHMGRAVKEERRCPAAAELASCPEVCTCLMMAMEAGTFSVINAQLAVPEITKLLSKGDDCCLAVIEVLTAGAWAGQVSPQATPGQFAPVIRVPGLQARLMARGLLSVGKALYALATNSQQKMMWYEFFRYQPGDCRN